MPILTILALNFILYSFLSYKYWKKEGMSLSFSLSIFYTAVALMGFIIIPTGIYEAVIPITNRTISFIPYLLCFISIWILIKPLERVNFTRFYLYEFKNNSIFNKIVNLWIIDFVLFGILKFSHVIMASSMGFDELYDAANVDGNLNDMFYGENKFLLAFNNFNINLLNSFVPFVMCYAFYKLIREGDCGKSYIIIALVFLVKCFIALSMGSRGNLFFTLWSFVVYYVLFFPFLNKSIQKKFIRIGTIGTFIISVYLILISIDRLANSNTETPITSILRYFGEAFPNLGNSFWGKVQTHPYGFRLFFDGVYSQESVQDGYTFWQAYTGVPVLNFKTIFGDLYVEFGTTIALLIIVGLSIGFKWFIGNGKIDFWKFSFILWYFELVLQGVFGFVKSGYSSFIIFIAILLVSLVVKCIIPKVRKR